MTAMTTKRIIRKAPQSVLDSITNNIKEFGSDADLHRQTSIPQPTITRLRHQGINNPSIDLLLDLAKGLNKSLDELVGLTNSATESLAPQ